MIILSNNEQQIQVIDGQEYFVEAFTEGFYGETSVCCDCGLKHTIIYRPVGDQLGITVWRHKRTDKQTIEDFKDRMQYELFERGEENE